MEATARVALLALLLTLGAAISVARLALLQIGQNSFWEEESVKARTRSHGVAFRRGSIVDALGTPLATSQVARDLYFELAGFRKGTQLGRLMMVEHLLTALRPTLSELLESPRSILERVVDLRVGDYRRLSPLRRREDLRFYVLGLFGVPSLKDWVADLERAQDEAPFFAEAAARVDSVVEQIRRECGILQAISSAAAVEPQDLIARVDEHIGSIDRRVLRSLEVARERARRDLYLLERELHRELDYEEVELLRNVPYELARDAHHMLAGFLGKECVRRVYPEEVLAEIVGWVGKPSDEDLKLRNAHLDEISRLLLSDERSLEEADLLDELREQVRAEDPSPDEERGRIGLELAYESALRGRRGYVKRIASVDGRTIEEIERVDSTPGRDVQLTVRCDWQESAEQVLEEVSRTHGSVGAFVLIELPSRKIRVMASFPRPVRLEMRNLYAELVALEETLARSPKEVIGVPVERRFPLHPCAYRPFFPPAPGSSFKPFVAVMALSEGVATAQTRFTCTHQMTVEDRTLGCLGMHGDVDVTEALVKSCNHFFAHLALEVGYERLFAWAETFGFGSSTRFADATLVDEHQVIECGTSETRGALKKAEKGKRNLMLFGFGQGAIDDVTPLQVAAAMGALAVRSYLPPTLIEAVGDCRVHRPQERRIAITENAWKTVVTALGEVTRRGTAAPSPALGLDLSGYDLATKTGTAQVGGGLPDHSWTAGFFPIRAPRFAFALFLEHTGAHGGEAAAPAFQRILEHPAFAEVLAAARNEPVH